MDSQDRGCRHRVLSYGRLDLLFYSLTMPNDNDFGGDYSGPNHQKIPMPNDNAWEAEFDRLFVTSQQQTGRKEPGYVRRQIPEGIKAFIRQLRQQDAKAVVGAMSEDVGDCAACLGYELETCKSPMHARAAVIKAWKERGVEVE